MISTETVLYRCPACQEVWRSDLEFHSYKHRHVPVPDSDPRIEARKRAVARAWAVPDPTQPVEYPLISFADDGRVLDEDHDLRFMTWVA